MSKQKIKLSLYIKVEDTVGRVDFRVLPDYAVCTALDDRTLMYSWDYDPSSMFTVSVVVDKIEGIDSNIQIKKITGDDIDISNLSKCSTYKRFSDNAIIKNTYGYMSWPGEYKIKIRFSPMIHRYINNFLEQATKSN